MTSLLCRLPERESITLSTEPSVDISKSSRIAWSMPGNRDDRVASFRSVESSSSSLVKSGIVFGRGGGERGSLTLLPEMMKESILTIF